MDEREDSERPQPTAAQRRHYLIVFALLGVVALALVVVGTLAAIDHLSH